MSSQEVFGDLGAGVRAADDEDVARWQLRGVAVFAAVELNDVRGEIGGEPRNAGLLVRTGRDNDLTRPYPNMGYRQYPRIREEITSLSGSVSRGTSRPTEGQALRMKELAEELDRAVAALNKIQTEQIGKINELMKGTPYISTETIK